MSWPLLNVGLTAGRVQESEANLLGAETRLRQTELSVGSEVVQGYLSVQTARQKVTAAEAEVASAEESLRLATGRYETGVAVYIEVIDAETAALTARTNLVNGRYALSTSLAALEAALGLEQGE
jgi:outer membrane protein TolC